MDTLKLDLSLSLVRARLTHSVGFSDRLLCISFLELLSLQAQSFVSGIGGQTPDVNRACVDCQLHHRSD